MQRLSHLPPPPHLSCDVIEELPPERPGFLRRVSRELSLVGTDGERTPPFVYDEIARDALDAVVVAAHFLAPDQKGEEAHFVVLRSAVRPPVALRDAGASPCTEPDNRALWELPAGLVEPNEASPAGLLQAAARELFEETGFEVGVDCLVPLGPSAFPAPGMVAERQFFFRAAVDPRSQEAPALDGSPLEAVGELVAVPLEVALQAAREGRLADAKTELGLRRLFEALMETV